MAKLMIFVTSLAMTGSLIDPRVIDVVPEKPVRGFGSGTTSNDIDPVGSNSPAGVTQVGLMGTTDAAETTLTQRIPPIRSSSQYRSPPINQTTISEQTGVRVWNRPGNRPISPTHLDQNQGELTELRGMMTSIIDEIRGQRTTNQALANRLDQAEKELAEYQATNARERNRAPLDPLRATSNVQSTGLFGIPEIPSARSG